MRLRGFKGFLVTALCVAATGCRHKQPVPPVPAPPSATVPLEKAPSPPLVSQVPTEPAPLPSIVVPVKKVKKPRKKPAVPVVAVAPPVNEVASAGPEPKLAIGSLTAGGATAPANRQQAVTMLAELDKRLGALSAETARDQRDGIARVHNFEREARKAIDSGDGEGAVTLATKAKVLLDDLLK